MLRVLRPTFRNTESPSPSVFAPILLSSDPFLGLSLSPLANLKHDLFLPLEIPPFWFVPLRSWGRSVRWLSIPILIPNEQRSGCRLHVGRQVLQSRQRPEEHIWEFVRMGSKRKGGQGGGRGPAALDQQHTLHTPLHSFPSSASQVIWSLLHSALLPLGLRSLPSRFRYSTSGGPSQLYLPTSASGGRSSAQRRGSAASCPCDTRERKGKRKRPRPPAANASRAWATPHSCK